jgi:hypothetical protein
MEDYLNSQKKDDPLIEPGTKGAPKELTFAEITYLIESNKVDLIPNNKTIPDVLNVSSSTLWLLAIDTRTGHPPKRTGGKAQKKALGVHPMHRIE